MSEKETYDKHRPFFARIKERIRLSKSGSQKNTFHLVLDLADSGMTYEPGDSIGIYPVHDGELIDKTLHALKATGDERVAPKSGTGSMTLRELLRAKANITEISPRFYREVCRKQSNSEKSFFLSDLQKEENREAYKAYVESREIWDFLSENGEVHFDVQEFVDCLMPLLPRFYSISSSQKHVGNEVHLTVASLEYESNGYPRRGVCTHYLCRSVAIGDPVVPIFVQSSGGFRLPEDPHAHPLIMIGPGTGVAPFRAFMQERLLHHRSTASHWLFFGERTRVHDFLYEEEWGEFEKIGKLKVDSAFSRDREKKVYVQHLMRERGAELYRWLTEENAFLYVCGDARRMAKDVEAELVDIVREFGKKEPDQARNYVKELRKQKRYLRDVY